MGIDILWLMPVNPIGVTNRKGTLGSYYSVKDYMAVNPEFGTIDDLKSLVNKAHENGMKVIIDWVANHTSWDNKLITEHPDWYTKDSKGKIIAPVPDWTDVADLDYSKKGLCDYMTEAMKFWIKNADIDGFRCDVAEMVPPGFWKETIPQLKKMKDVFMLAEGESPLMHEIGFDMTYSWNLFHTMIEIKKGLKTAIEIDSLILKEEKTYPPDSYRMRFTSNHDENTWNGTEYEFFGDAARTFSTLTFLLPGMPLIYSGQEAGLSKRLKFFDKDTINWTDLTLQRYYSNLIKLKKENICLANGDSGGVFSVINNDHTDKVLSFLRKKENNSILVFCNLSPTMINIKTISGIPSGTWKNYNTGLQFTSADLKSQDLAPWECRILLKR